MAAAKVANSTIATRIGADRMSKRIPAPDLVSMMRPNTGASNRNFMFQSYDGAAFVFEVSQHRTDCWPGLERLDEPSFAVNCELPKLGFGQWTDGLDGAARSGNQTVGR
jgi:hypothetical protein